MVEVEKKKSEIRGKGSLLRKEQIRRRKIDGYREKKLRDFAINIKETALKLGGVDFGWSAARDQKISENKDPEIW